MGPAVTGREHVSESFVARIWLESGSNGDPVWRGHIRHVQGDQEAYFQDLGKMNEFLERVSGLPGLHSSGRATENTGVSTPAPTAKAKGNFGKDRNEIWKRHHGNRQR